MMGEHYSREHVIEDDLLLDYDINDLKGDDDADLGDLDIGVDNTVSTVQADSRDSVASLWAIVKELGDAALGGIEADWAVDAVDGEEDLHGAFGDGSQLDYASEIYLSEPVKSKRRRIKEARLERLDESDFEEGAQRKAFILLRDRVRACFLKKVSPRERHDSMQWVFTYQPNADKITFDLCCDVLMSRANRIRMRLHYEFWRRWVVLNGALGFMTAVMPEEWISRALYVAGEDGVQLAGMIWRWPSVCQHDLEREGIEKGLSEKECRLALERLIASGLVQVQGVNLYLTGRGFVEYGEKLGF